LVAFLAILLFDSNRIWAQTPVFINEIHYDNTGTDTGEAIEIAGPAGTDLSGWSIVRYNGATGAAYTLPAADPLGSDILIGTIPDLGDGFGMVVVNYVTNGIQNGSPDGIALVDDTNSVVQFLSYEGSFTAVDGPATGMMSTDIGVSEPSDTPVGDSLQLTGTGTYFEDFTWISTAPNTFGDYNTGQVFTTNGGEPPSLVISEIMYNPASIPDNPWEWVELVNAGTTVVDLAGFVLDDDDLEVLSAPNISAGSIAPGETAILFDTENNDAPAFTAAWGAGMNLVPVTDWPELSNQSDRVALWDNLDNYNNRNFANAVDDVAYNDISPWPLDDGISSIYLTDLNSDNSLGANWALSVVSVNTPAGIVYESNPAGDNNATNIGSPGGELVTYEFRKIHEVQGSGLVSPFKNLTVTIEGVVVGDFQSGLNGFYVQEEDADADLDSATSEGIFVYAPRSIDVNEGDIVQVAGTVSEAFEETQISDLISLNVLDTNQSRLVSSTEVMLPFPSVDFPERYEGMAVTLPQTLTVTDQFNLARFGQVTMCSGGLLFNPTSVTSPGSSAIALQQANDLNRLIVDDDNNGQNPADILLVDPEINATAGITLRGGDTAKGISGILGFAFSEYRVRVNGPVNFVAANPRPQTPENVGAILKVASFNVLNYFNGDGLGGGFPTSRGADTPSEFQRQRDKIIDAILDIDADILGLVDLENDGYGATSAIQDLVNGLNAVAGAGTYAPVDPGVPQIGTDEIAVGLIYKRASFTPVGRTAILDSSVDPRFIDTKNRPSLAQSFRENVTGEKLTIAVNHFKSKGSSCDDVGDPDLGDGQGNCPITRTKAALALVDWLSTDPTGSGDPDFLIIGDLNAYAMEDPITEIKKAGYTNLIEQLVGLNAYSYVFDGQWGYLDHALSSASLTPQVTGATTWHVNADEPRFLDYNEEFQTPGQVINWYNPDQFRSSDHDPVLIGFSLKPDCPGDFDNDRDVDGSDLAVFATDFGRTDCVNLPPCEGDFDNDGDVDGSDLAEFAKDFGRTDCP
jgi:predicted extracellular nuclease